MKEGEVTSRENMELKTKDIDLKKFLNDCKNAQIELKKLLN